MRGVLRDLFGEDLQRTGRVTFSEAMVYRTTPRHPAPPLPALLGRGPANAELRIKLWLWFLVLANGRARKGSAPRVDRIDLAPRRLMERLGLEAGTDDDRRIGRAVQRLVDDRLLRPVSRSGDRFDVAREDFPTIRPQREPGRDDLYDRDWASRAATRRGDFVMPLGLWSNGWLTALDHRALCVLFALRHMCPDSGPWYRVPRILRDRYTLTPPVWNSGVRELYVHGIIDVVEIGTGAAPQRWIQADWGRLSAAAGPDRSRAAYRAARAGGTVRRFRHAATIEEAFETLPELVYNPVPAGRPVIDLEELAKTQRDLAALFARWDRENVMEVSAAMDELRDRLDFDEPKSVQQLTRRSHYRDRRAEERLFVAALLDALVTRGDARCHRLKRGAVSIPAYTRVR